MEPLQAEDPEAFGPYQLLARLGSGGMGQVFLGRSGSGRLVAVKVVHDSLSADPEFRARFRREATAARAVSGAFTAPVIDADPDAPSPWLVTAYLPGMSLQEAVDAHGPFPAAAVTALGAFLTEGLAAVHRAGVVHRDLKPANVLLTLDGPRVIDFGIALAADGSAITRSGMLVGSPGYMSPEQTGERDTGPPGDVFSLGAVLAFAATGTGPFGTGAMHAMVYRVLNEAPRVDGIADPRLRTLVLACLDKDPVRRPTLDRLLQSLLDGLPERTPPQGAGWLPAALAADLAQHAARTPQGPVRAAATAPGRPRAGRRGPGRRSVLTLGLACAGAVGLGGAAAALYLTGTAEALLSPDDDKGGGRPKTTKPLWTWTKPDGQVSVGPVLSGGLAFAVCASEGVPTVVGLDAGSGKARWETPLRDDAPRILGIGGGTGYLYTTKREVLAFDTRGGDERWRLPAHGLDGPLATSGGVLFLPGADAKTGRAGLLAVDTATGRPRWHLPVASGFTGPAVAGGVLYLGGDEFFMAVTAATGRPLWSVETSSRVSGTPVVVGDTVYFSSERGFNAVDTADGALRWSVLNAGMKALTGGWVPTIAGRQVYLPSADGTLRAFDATAKGEARTLWSFQVGAPRPALRGPNPRFLAPAVTGGIACVFNGAGELIGLDTRTGGPRWRLPVAAADTELPVAAGDAVHMATNDGLLSIEPASGEVLGRTDGLRTGDLSTADGVLYFSGSPLNEKRPTTVYAARA